MDTVPWVARRDAPADATRELYERYGAQIFVFCLHQLGSREEAEDAVQSTFLNAFRGLKRGVVPVSEPAWLFKIAQNVCLTRRRSIWRRGRVEAPNDLEALGELVPAPAAVDPHELITLEDALGAMPASQRRAILLREWQGLSYREIGEELGLSQAAVEALIFRARRSLAWRLEQESSRRVGRVRQAFDAGWLVFALKTLVGGGAATKAAATAAVATTAVVVAAGPLSSRVERAPAPSEAVSRHATAELRAPAAVVSEPRAIVRSTEASPTPVERRVRKRAVGRVVPKPKAKASRPAAARRVPKPVAPPSKSEATPPPAAPEAPPAPKHATPPPAATPEPRAAPPPRSAAPAAAAANTPGSPNGNANGHAKPEKQKTKKAEPAAPDQAPPAPPAHAAPPAAAPEHPQPPQQAQTAPPAATPAPSAPPGQSSEDEDDDGDDDGDDKEKKDRAGED